MSYSPGRETEAEMGHHKYVATARTAGGVTRGMTVCWYGIVAPVV